MHNEPPYPQRRTVLQITAGLAAAASTVAGSAHAAGAHRQTRPPKAAC